MNTPDIWKHLAYKEYQISLLEGNSQQCFLGKIFVNLVLKTFSVFLNFDLFTRDFYQVIMENNYHRCSGSRGRELKGINE